MKSKWYKLKPKAIYLRKRGYSLRKIGSRFMIPRSTLSYWLRDIKLTTKQKKELLQNWKYGLIKARKNAVIWHNAEKEKRINEAKNLAEETLKNINLNDKNILEFSLALLYLGEGSKKNSETALGSSDPLILKFFLSLLIDIYKINTNRLSCDLSLRADQNPEEIKHFWSQTLKLPLSYFKQIHIDKRTKGKKTYSYYKGVCNIRYGNIAIRRKLVFIANLFCEKIIKKGHIAQLVRAPH